MAYTESSMLPLGTKAPDFKLHDTVSGKPLTLKDVTGERGVVIMFICNHCPFVKHINAAITEIARTYSKKGIGFVGISSNDVSNYPDDSPEKMKEVAKNEGYTFPYLYDESQTVARSYQAECTPEFYLFDRDLYLVYRGQMDNSRPGNDITPTGEDLTTAMDNLLRGRPIDPNQRPGGGCNIKWKPEMLESMKE
jgi:peroxiredoxin